MTTQPIGGSSPGRILPHDAPAQCDVSGCRRDHEAEVEFATNHMANPPDPAGIASAPVNVRLPDQSCVVLWDGWDPLIVDDHTTSVTMDPTARAVAVARLRSIADLIEGEAT